MVFSFFSERPAQQWGQRHGYNNQTNDVWLSSRVIVIDSTLRGPRFRQVWGWGWRMRNPHTCSVPPNSCRYGTYILYFH